MLANVNLTKEEPILIAESLIDPQSNPMTICPTPFTWISRILEEEFATVKDSITFRLPTQGHEEGVEANGSSGCPVIPESKFGKGYMAKDDGTEGVQDGPPIGHF